MSTDIFRSLNFEHNLSFVHHNVQSVFPKLDILHTELFHFDILAFTDTWLTPPIDTDDVLLPAFKASERKDRVEDNHGGVMLYVREYIISVVEI